MSPQRILIAGCGDLGRRAGEMWVSQGAQVWGIRRSRGALPGGLRALSADLTDPASLGRALDRRRLGLEGDDRFDLLVFSTSADRFEDAAYRAAYVDALGTTLKVLGEEDLLPSRLVYVSSTSVYAQTDGQWVTEESSTEPEGFGGKRLLEGEALVAEAPIPERTVVRFGGIYGPGRARLLDSVRSGQAVCYDDPPIWTNRIHVEDCARALVHLGAVEEPQRLYLGVDDRPTLDGEVKRRLAELLGVDAPPAAIAPPSQTSRRMRSNKRCSNARLRESGFVPRYPSFEEGYGAMIDG